MKLKKLMCCTLASLTLIVPLLSGCKHIEKDEIFKTESNSSQSQISAESSDDSSTDNQITPAMWKAEDNDGNYIYLFGSIHAGDNAVNHMPDYFEKAYAECDALSFEIDMSNLLSDMESTVQMITDLMYTDGTTIKDHVSEDTYNKLVKILQDNNLYNSLYDYYKPLMWESLIENIIISKAGLDSMKGVDMTLTNRAKNDGKTIMEAESMEFQTDLFNNFSDELIEMLLSTYTADNAIEEQTAALKELYEKWKSGTMTADDTDDDIDESMLTDEEKELLEEYNNGLLINRNENMAEKVVEYMQSDKTVMLVVGAAHYLGEGGIINLLEEKGITVTRITSADQMISNEKLAA